MIKWLLWRATESTLCSCAPIHPPTCLFFPPPRAHHRVLCLNPPDEVPQSQDAACCHSAALMPCTGGCGLHFYNPPGSSFNYLCLEKRQKIPHEDTTLQIKQKAFGCRRKNISNSPGCPLTSKWKINVTIRTKTIRKITLTVKEKANWSNSLTYVELSRVSSRVHFEAYPEGVWIKLTPSPPQTICISRSCCSLWFCLVFGFFLVLFLSQWDK